MKYFIYTLAAVVSCSAMSFGKTGHRITGAIAEKYLTETTRQSIESIIGNETLAEASTYVDEMKSNPSEFWRKTANPYHYVTVPKGKTYAQVGAPKKSDAVEALKKYSKVLKDKKASKADKAVALKFIVHIIGDLHQPLHAGNGDDRGGNDVKLRFFWQDSNLHRVWDSGLIDQQKLSYTEWTNFLNRTITPDTILQWTTTNPEDWIAESTKIRDTIYPKEDNLTWDYQYQHLPTLKLRLKQGGVRIAVYLNELFDPTHN
ncbi:S1/P1 nuclease [Pleionea sediminis]|uniref:S1/P1 nuclease n=1 Tax=Pleionea sediminis TaxID=2569479 RepID=UPI0011853EFC|nr:S1/P1 nuclease [Pleionea sediminis]